MAEILEDHIRLHITHPERGPGSREELTEDLIGLVRAYLKWGAADPVWWSTRIGV